ncbi:E3 ubiquitin-protein ligase pub1 [Coemansia helicoidea]|uniref:E3 ubiquitin-protein ligase pub1 n=1 Tax=Coemansia helicoidea TaxID=1286919 RepID=A0ACC1KFD5_9FUNG|nr:E3 ubiquitin-protein ligase pub1 [Coemansia helicoidea]
MDGPAAAALGNGAPPGGMYVPQHPHPAATMNGSVQFAAPPKAEDTAAKTLYVGNLDPRVTEKVLLEVFSTVCLVASIKIIPDMRVSTRPAQVAARATRRMHILYKEERRRPHAAAAAAYTDMPPRAAPL